MDDVAAEYKPMLGTPFVVLIIGGLGLGGAAAVVATVFEIGTQDTGPPPWWFLALFGLAWAWNAYVYLFRIATSLRLEGQTLVWSAPLQRGSIEVSRLRGVRPVARLNKQMVVCKDVNERRVSGVFNGPGLSDLAAAVEAVNPRFEVDV